MSIENSEDEHASHLQKDAVQVALRKARAVELRIAGMNYDAIARELGLANRGTAWRLVNQAMKERVVERVDEHRELELQRLDALQAAFWGNALAGDPKAATIVLKVIDMRIRLLGLEHAPKDTEPKTILIRGDTSEHFIADLKAINGGR